MSAEEAIPPLPPPVPRAPEHAELGVLFVHGIGSQRRGDTLIQCGDAVHDWLRGWLTWGPFGEWAVEPADTLLASGASEEGPAHSRPIFRRGAEVSPTSWLLAESCWAEVFRPPSYREFARWALRIVPFAVILHLVPRFRRAWCLWQDVEKSLEAGWVSQATLSDLEFELGRPAPIPITRDLLALVGLRMVGRVLFSGLLLAPLAVFGLAIQLLLLAVMLVAVIPLGFLRSFATRVQQALTAAIGDSYLFLASPITGSAVVTQVQQDLVWLARRSDRVCIVAHSQGAAVTYRALQHLSLKGGLPGNLKLLITYGSGLRKLFDLERASRNAGRWTFYGVVALALSVGAALSIGAAILGVLGMQDRIHVALAVSGMAICTTILIGLLLAASGLARRPEDKEEGEVDGEKRAAAEEQAARHLAENDPEVLPVEWDDLYASHDPVPNGPIAVRAPRRPQGTVADHVKDAVAVEAFRRRQRQVVNQRSASSDHTSYWSSKDDFVGRVVTRVARLADMPIELTLDKTWLDISAARRLWRVRLLSGCRGVAALALLCLVLWGLDSGREFLTRVGALVPALPAAAQRLLTELPQWVQGIPFPPWSLGAAC